MAVDHRIRSKWFPTWVICECGANAEFETEFTRERWVGHHRPPEETKVVKNLCSTHAREWADRWGMALPEFNKETRRP